MEKLDKVRASFVKFPISYSGDKDDRGDKSREDFVSGAECAEKHYLEVIEALKKDYQELVAKANGFDLQRKCFEAIREELVPTEKDTHLPWYEMLAKCVKNKQLK